jgi:uncharacterized protein YndB with AHSA1/START domain
MTDAALKPDTQEIVVDTILPHALSTVWKALTTAELISRWLKMPLTGFEPVKGNRFTYRTSPAGEWDGTIQCEVLDVQPNRRLAYSWKGGHAGNAGYGAPLDTIVTWTLAATEAGTRLRLVHSGFVSPRNDNALRVMGQGWKTVVTERIPAVADELKN